jgi:hypothetical protein
MKIGRIATLLAAIMVAECATFAQGGLSIPQQWTIVTTSESTANAAPISYTAAGVYSPCTTGQNDNSNDSNPNCFNPLTITTDMTMSGNFSNMTATPVVANTFTNSSCSAMGGVQKITMSGYSIFSNYSSILTVTLIDDNGATNTITFTGAKSRNYAQFTGTFASSGPCMKNDKGNFTATLFQTISGTFKGSFESNGSFGEGGTGAVTLVLATDSNFNVTGTAVALPGSGLCFSNLTIATTLANTYLPSMATGDALEFVATDATGNAVLFTATGTSGTGQQEGLNSAGNQMLYLTYTGLSGACSGKSGIDIPFSKDSGVSAPRHGGVFGGRWSGPGSLGNLNRMRSSRW